MDATASGKNRRHAHVRGFNLIFLFSQSIRLRVAYSSARQAYICLSRSGFFYLPSQSKILKHGLVVKSSVNFELPHTQQPVFLLMLGKSKSATQIHELIR